MRCAAAVLLLILSLLVACKEQTETVPELPAPPGDAPAEEAPAAPPQAEAEQAAEPTPLDQLQALYREGRDEEVLELARQLADHPDSNTRENAAEIAIDLLNDKVEAKHDGSWAEFFAFFSLAAQRCPWAAHRVYPKLQRQIDRALPDLTDDEKLQILQELAAMAPIHDGEVKRQLIQVPWEIWMQSGNAEALAITAQLALRRSTPTETLNGLRGYMESEALAARLREVPESAAESRVLLLLLLGNHPQNEEWLEPWREATRALAGQWLEAPPPNLNINAPAVLMQSLQSREPDPDFLLARALKYHAVQLAHLGEDAHIEHELAYSASMDNWRNLLQRMDFDYYADLPEEWRERLEDEIPWDAPEQKKRLVISWLNRDELLPLSLRDYREAAIESRLSTNLQKLRNTLYSPQQTTLNSLRDILRNQATDARLAAIRDGLQAAIVNAVRDEGWSRVEILAGFYVAELPNAPDDGWRATLLEHLQTASSEVADQPRRQIFLLSLIADLYSGDPAGVEARRQALEIATAIAAPLAFERENEEVIGTTNLAGLSLTKAENRTADPLLIIMTGPEHFFVRLDPWREAAFAFNDGEYEILTLVPDEGVRPLRTRGTFAGEITHSRYIIKDDGQTPAWALHHTPGHFPLLRHPPNANTDAIQQLLGPLDRRQDTTDPLQAALKVPMSASAREGREAVEELMQHRKNRQAFEALRGLALEYREPAIRSLALEALLPFRDYFDAYRVWIEALRTDTESGPRRTALSFILRLPHEQRGAVLREVISTAEGRQLLRSFVGRDSIPGLDWQQHSSLLVAAWKAAEPNSSEATAFLRAMAELRLPASLAIIDRMLQHEESAVRRGAISPLRPWDGHAEALPILLNAMQREKESRVLYSLALALGHYDSLDKGRAAIADVLRGNRSRLHRAVLVGVVDELQHYDDPAFLQALSTYAINGDSEDARLFCACVLAHNRHAASVPAIVKVYGETDDTYRLKRAIGDWPEPTLQKLIAK